MQLSLRVQDIKEMGEMRNADINSAMNTLALDKQTDSTAECNALPK